MDLIQLLILVIIGILLLYFGYTLFLRMGLSPGRGGEGKGAEPLRGKGAKSRGKTPGSPAEPQICPVCSAKLEPGEQVSSAAFPPKEGSTDRFMHIKGCVYCLGGERERVCPVCALVLKNDEILVARLFERSIRRTHVHVLGCTRCRGPRGGR